MAISESVSNIGSWITMMAVFSLVIFKGAGNVTESGLIYLVGLLPALVFSPVAGWLCDHFDRRKLMIISEVASGLAVSGIIFTESLTLLYVLLALQAISGSIMTPARQSSVPQVVDREQLTQANAFLQQISSVVKIFGPVLAGAVLAVMNAHQAVILDVISYFLSAGILLLLPKLIPPQQKSQLSKTDDKQKWTVQLSELLHLDNQLKLLFGMAFMAIVGIVSIDILASIFTRDVLSSGESYFGLIIGMIGFGTLIGAATLMLSKKAPHPWRDVIGGFAAMAVLPACMAAGYHVHDLVLLRFVTIPVCVVAGFGMGRKLVQDNTLIQTLTPESILGRVSGLYQSTIIAAQLIGTILTSALVPGLIPVDVYFGLTALLILAVSIFGLIFLQRAKSNKKSLLKVSED
jgi:MFS family permease